MTDPGDAAVESTASQRLTEARVRAIKPGPKQRVYVDALGLELLVTPSGGKIWRFRWREGGQQRRETIGRHREMTLAVAREQAAKLRARLWGGERLVPERPPESAPIEDAVETYLHQHRDVWTPGTARTYGSAIRAFLAWAAGARVLTADQVTPRALAAFRAHAVSQPRRAKAKGGSRRDVVSTGERRSTAAVNCELRAVKTMLQSLRRAGVFVHLSSDDIVDNMGLLTIDRERPAPLRPGELRSLLDACARHDADHEPIAPLVLTLLLSGLRLGEALRLHRADVDLDELVIRVAAGKTHREREVDLAVSPALTRLLSGLKSRSRGPVFAWTQATALDARQRLITEYGAPPFLWSTRHSRPGERSAPTLRSTCGCYLACAPSIFGAASVYRSAAQLGHSVQVAERHYLGALRRIPPDATTLEAAMQVESEVERLIGRRRPRLVSIG